MICLLFAALALQSPSAAAPKATPATGVTIHEADVAPGYTLFAPLNAGSTWLIDANGKGVHSWQRETSPGNSVYLLPNGHLLRTERPDSDSPLSAGGEGGRIVELDWDGAVLWTYELSSDVARLHHDIEPLPNGNVLAIVWTMKSAEEAKRLGRDPASLGDEGLWPDAIFELEPTRPRGARVVWEWHAFDHLVQDLNEDLPGYGVVAEQVRRINVNIGTDAAKRPETAEERTRRLEMEEKLRALGYTGGNDDDDQDDGGRRGHADWMHTNSIDYDAELDLIAISPRNLGEVWIIDHSTTTEEARGSTGGKQGVGGDLVWRYGNPVNYHAGETSDRVAFGQHDAQWTRVDGKPALSIFNNGEGRPGKDHYSSVDLIVIPTNESGRIAAPTNGRFMPSAPTSIWTAEVPTSMYSGHISGAEPLPTGGFLVCDGESGRLIETAADGSVVWEFISPLQGSLERAPRRRSGGPRGPRPDGPPPGDRNGRDGDPPPRDGGDGADGTNAPRVVPQQARGPRSPNAIFRASRIAPDHPGLADRKLDPHDLPKAPAPPPRPDGSDREGDLPR